MEETVKRYILESLREKYHRSDRKGKSAILQEAQTLLACHRKHAVRVMKKRAPGRKPAPGKRGRKSKYDTPEFLSALHKVRRIMEFRNAEVIKGNMAEWLPFIEKHYNAFPLGVAEKLYSISAATMKRYFRRMREQGGKGLSTTRPGSILRTEIPILTESQWEATVPGKMATDTVAHCGNTTEGQHIFSLDMVDPVTHWTAQRATWGKGSGGVLDQTKGIESALPFKLIGLHVDNGSEFLNYHFVRYFTRDPVRTNFWFTRSRANHKNDNCHVEQKNWSVVRRYFGYERLDFPELVPLMNDLYENELYLYLNHFCRTFKLSQKIAIKSRYRRIYGDPLTPYERVLASPHVEQASKDKLIEQHAQLDPVFLKIEIERKLRKIFATFKKLLAARKAASAA
jgi:hypothetical protein